MKMSHEWLLNDFIQDVSPISFNFSDQPEVKSSIVQSGPAGYYYQGAWQALSGTTVRQFNTSSAISKCLKGKKVYLYGDSTVRQWFEYLNAALPGS